MTGVITLVLIVVLILIAILSWALVRLGLELEDILDEYRLIITRLEYMNQSIGHAHGCIYELNHEIENLKEKKNEY